MDDVGPSKLQTPLPGRPCLVIQWSLFMWTVVTSMSSRSNLDLDLSSPGPVCSLEVLCFPELP